MEGPATNMEPPAPRRNRQPGKVMTIGTDNAAEDAITGTRHNSMDMPVRHYWGQADGSSSSGIVV